jgi:hypothetical protein
MLEVYSKIPNHGRKVAKIIAFLGNKIRGLPVLKGEGGVLNEFSIGPPSFQPF